MYQSFFFTFPDNLDLDSQKDIQAYSGYVLTLPFRLRTGAIFSANVGESFNIIFRNRLDIPNSMADEEVSMLIWEGKRLRPRDQFFTEALILERHHPITIDFLEQAIAFAKNPVDYPMPDAKPQYFQALTSLNDAIVGYHHATNSLFGGTVVERLTTPTFFDRLRYLHTIICPIGYEFSQLNLIEILDARGDKQIIQQEGQFMISQLADAPRIQLESIQQYIKLNQRFLFYQFALDAKSKMVEQDFVSAILYAVIALEGVHSTLLQMRFDRLLTSSIADPNIRAKKAEEIANQLLMEIGISKSLEITSLLFLETRDKPSEEQIRQCQLGITIRNEIMHALAKKGQYRLRNRTSKMISEAYAGVFDLCNHFIKIVERETQTEITTY